MRKRGVGIKYAVEMWTDDFNNPEYFQVPIFINNKVKGLRMNDKIIFIELRQIKFD